MELTLECLKYAITEFAAKLQTEAAADPFFLNMENVESPNYTVTFGRKYARVISRDDNGAGGSVWGFVEILTGDIYKAAGWKAPAKHVRGNIADAEYGKNYRWTGPNYLR